MRGFLATMSLVIFALGPTQSIAECECTDDISDAIADYESENGTPEDNQQDGRDEVCVRVAQLNLPLFQQLAHEQLCGDGLPEGSPL